MDALRATLVLSVKPGGELRCSLRLDGAHSPPENVARVTAPGLFRPTTVELTASSELPGFPILVALENFAPLLLHFRESTFR